MESLALLLTQTPPRERAGSRTSNRITFQHDWTLCKILELHDQDAKYAVLCDYLEDVVVLDDEDEPTKAYPIQIKTGSSRLSHGALLKTKAGKQGEKPSIIGKLYVGCSNYSTCVPELRLVTTAAYNLKLSVPPASTERTQFGFSDLHPNIADQIRRHLIDKNLIPQLATPVPDLIFEVSPLSIKDHQTHAKGILTTFLERKFPGKPIPSAAAYQAISAEIARLSSYEDHLATFSDILKQKSFGRSKFNDILTQIPIGSNPSEIWIQVANRLGTDHCSYATEQKIRNAWREYEANRMDLTNRILQVTRVEIRENMIKESNSGNHLKLLDAVQLAIQSYQQKNFYSEEYLQAIAILEYYEYQLSPSYSQS